MHADYAICYVISIENVIIILISMFTIVYICVDSRITIDVKKCMFFMKQTTLSNQSEIISKCSPIRY